MGGFEETEESELDCGIGRRGQSQNRRQVRSQRGSRRKGASKDDMRHFGPFNVDRAPTGQFAPKGSVDSRIQRFPDSKTKVER